MSTSINQCLQPRAHQSTSAAARSTSIKLCCSHEHINQAVLADAPSQTDGCGRFQGCRAHGIQPLFESRWSSPCTWSSVWCDKHICNLSSMLETGNTKMSVGCLGALGKKTSVRASNLKPSCGGCHPPCASLQGERQCLPVLT